MPDFKIKTSDNQIIHFNFYKNDAPITCDAFVNLLPFTLTFMHARVSGEEIWSNQFPELDIIQENASVFTEVGEIVLGPLKPARAKTAKAIGIYYGDGKGLDCANIFGKVILKDLPKLKELGNKIWRQGMQDLTFEKAD
jgi:hypothetical protein